MSIGMQGGRNDDWTTRTYAEGYDAVQLTNTHFERHCVLRTVTTRGWNAAESEREEKCFVEEKVKNTRSLSYVK